MKEASFKVRTKELMAVLKKFKTLEKAGKKKESVLEVTVSNYGLKLVIPGIEMPVSASTMGAAKFVIRLWYFSAIVTAEKDEVLVFGLKEGQLSLRNFTWTVPTTFFDDDRILRSISLPLNYTWQDVARLYLSGKYTKEEIEFNKLTAEVTKAIKKLNADIDKASSVLSIYGVTREDIQELVSRSL